VLCAVSLAGAGPREDFLFRLEEHTGDDYRADVIGKLVTLKVGPKCQAKLADKDLSAIETAAAVAIEIADYAKTVTGDDWNAILGNARDKDRAKAIISGKIDAFASRFAMTIVVDGDDCDAKGHALWLQYWTELAKAVKQYPPPSGKAFITLEVTPRVKQVIFAASKDGSTFVFRAPRDIEPPEWIERLGRPFRQLVAGLPDDFAFSLMEHVGEYTRMWMVTRFHTFNVGKKCLARFADRNQGILTSAAAVGRDLLGFAKACGADDWSTIENQRANDRKTNQTLVYKMMSAFRPKLSVTINLDGDDCDGTDHAVWLKYWTSIANLLEQYPPRADKVTVILNVTAKAKGMSATVKDGTFVFTSARDFEPNAWLEPMQSVFRRSARKRP